MRIGFGYDVHPLVKGRPLILGGVKIPYELGLDGHSDADALIHAIIDAMLGALALGTIGEFFPDSDPSFRNISSLKLLGETAEIIRDRKASVINIDCTVVAEKPRLLPWLNAMKESMAKVLSLDPGRISVKAKKEEGLGFTGSLAGIKAYAVALLMEDNNETSA